MSSMWNWPGARWWRCDLHAHTPSSYDFVPLGMTERGAREWVDAARKNGLDSIAVTDHNTPNGIEFIQRAAKGSGLVVLPGVELTVGGIHLLCIFAATQGRDDVVAFLSSVGVQPADYATDITAQKATASKSVREVLDEARRVGVIVVAAHANGPKGLVYALEGQERIQSLHHPGLSGAEVTLYPAGRADSYEWNAPDFVRWIDGSCPDVARPVSLVLASDGHSYADLGRSFTWVKMTRPDREGLHLALLDGDGSLDPGWADNPGDPNRHAACVIESISISKAKYMGRNPSLHVALNPWLNAIIGGRGTGKSTLVDLARLVFRREQELTERSELRAVFDRRMRIPPSKTDEGLLTADTLVEIVYRKDGERFVLSWDQQVKAPAIALIDGDSRVPQEGDIRERFPVRIYSQKQLFELARDPNALIDVIDDTVDVGASEIRRSTREAESKYLALRAQARSLRTRSADVPNRRATLQDIQRKLDVLQQGGQAKTLAEFRSRRLLQTAWSEVLADARDRLGELARLADELEVSDLSIPAHEEGDAASDALRRAHAGARAVVDAAREAVIASIHAAEGDLNQVAAGGDSLEWGRAVATSETAYQALMTQLAVAGITNPGEYRDLMQRATAVRQEIAALEEQQAKAAQLDVLAAGELERYRGLRAELTSRRMSFVQDASGETIRIEIRGFSRRDDIELFFRDTLGIPRFDADYRELSERFERPDAEPVPWSYAGLDDLAASIHRAVADPTATLRVRDRRFEQALRQVAPERLDRLALYAPADSVEVSFRDSRDPANEWRRLSHGSPGQQTAALLAFVLGYGEEPIVLDQPEDDLDSTVIYDMLVPKLRESKKNRQVIVVTHNANIVVHGDAELVVSIDTEHGQTKTKAQGGLQEQIVRDEVCRVMEGGREAFDVRYRRIRQTGGSRG